mmetsp:Transcript_120127/g.256341  ORF Transcript_120127/g.256341 Transcript_120127/m.256341 type:complete len:211 (+) Transcript_120127:330-962(+)
MEPALRYLQGTRLGGCIDERSESLHIGLLSCLPGSLVPTLCSCQIARLGRRINNNVESNDVVPHTALGGHTVEALHSGEVAHLGQGVHQDCESSHIWPDLRRARFLEPAPCRHKIAAPCSRTDEGIVLGDIEADAGLPYALEPTLGGGQIPRAPRRADESGQGSERRGVGRSARLLCLAPPARGGRDIASLGRGTEQSTVESLVGSDARL